ncbi:MAG: winged helix DNA-binding domain-containing protein, partial [Chloroflexota bacterium]|nr:winged helix DNA-binding domain-containing protein [Chloroflexota bacterium]
MRDDQLLCVSRATRPALAAPRLPAETAPDAHPGDGSCHLLLQPYRRLGAAAGGTAARLPPPAGRSSRPQRGGRTHRTLTERALNRALLARQLLLERSWVSIEEAVERVGGLQTQYAPSGYVALWTRLSAFRRDDLTKALWDRTVVQATLMRTTIHLVSRREFWLYAVGIQRARRAWTLRIAGRDADEAPMVRAAERLREALKDGPRSVKELGGLADGFVGNHGLWVDLVRVPPSGTWERRRADRLALAEDWVGPCDTSEDDGLAHLVRAYLGAFGPAPWRDIAAWAGIPVA